VRINDRRVPVLRHRRRILLRRLRLPTVPLLLPSCLQGGFRHAGQCPDSRQRDLYFPVFRQVVSPVAVFLVAALRVVAFRVVAFRVARLGWLPELSRERLLALRAKERAAD
jgi:hypothetical protein